MAMPVFRVWDSTRKVKKMVMASTVAELKDKGCSKLSMERSRLQTVVLDIDGTEVEDDEILLLMEKEPMVFLGPNEEWVPQEKSVTSDKHVLPSSSTIKPSSSSTINIDVDTDRDDAVHPSAIIIDHVNNQEGAADFKISSPASFYLKSIQLPKFSPLVEKCLADKKPEVVWNQLVAESASFYFSQLAEGGEQQIYRAIGEKMYMAHPCIRMEGGSHAWTFFTKTLSQKVRHMRHNMKTKSQLNIHLSNKTDSSPLAKKFRVLKEVPREMTPNKAKTKEETTSHLIKLKEEWRKLHRNRDSTHIKMLLRETLDYRDEFLRSHTNSLLKDLVEEFPCFSDALYVLFEFAVRFGDKKLKEVSQSIKTVVATTFKMMGITNDQLTEGPETMTEVIKYLEEATKFDRSGKGRDGHFSSIIKIYENIEDDDVKNKLKSKEMTPPHLVIFKSESKKLAIYIVGDSIHITCQGSSVTSAITQLLAIYYVFDIDYPKCYAMVLGLLQIFVMNEAFTYETSKKFKFFAKKFRTVFDSFAKED